MSIRDDDPDFPPRDSKRAVKTTIVGGQPPGNDRSMPPVPVGIEELLGMAAVNPEFARALHLDRAAAVQASGVILTATEAQILGAIDEKLLATMVARVGGGVPNRDRRAFLSRASAALLVLAGGGAVAAAASCGEKRGPKERPDVAGGARPDYPYPDPEHPIEPPVLEDAGGEDGGAEDAGLPDGGGSGSDTTTTGVRPDRPPPPPTRGISPDRPEEKHPTRGIQPDRPLGRMPKTGHAPDRPPPSTRPIAGLISDDEAD